MAIHKNAEDGLISFRLIGAEVDDGCVRVSDLSNCMAKIQGCLKHVERCITGTSPSLQYVIKKMHVGSPADCELFAKTPKRKNDIRKSVSTLLLTTIASLAVRLRGPEIISGISESGEAGRRAIKPQAHCWRP